MSLEIYQYTKCGTCRKAIKFLDDLGVDYKSREITETPPSEPELRAMLKHYNGDIRKLFNTSGQLYRKLKMKDRLDTMTTEEAIGLLTQNGMLVKRPFLLTQETGLVGFKEDAWRSALE